MRGTDVKFSQLGSLIDGRAKTYGIFDLLREGFPIQVPGTGVDGVSAEEDEGFDLAGLESLD